MYMQEEEILGIFVSGFVIGFIGFITVILLVGYGIINIESKVPASNQLHKKDTVQYVETFK